MKRIPTVQYIEEGRGKWRWRLHCRYGLPMAESPRTFKTQGGARISLKATWRVMNRVVGKDHS